MKKFKAIIGFAISIIMVTSSFPVISFAALEEPDRTWSTVKADGFAGVDGDGDQYLKGGTTGGAGGTVYDVTTRAQFHAIFAQRAETKATDPIMVVMKGSMIEINPIKGDLGVMEPIRYTSNVTVIGDGATALLSGWGINVDHSSNIIIQNLTFKDASDDSINVQYSHHVLITHNTFTGGYDGLTDIKRSSNYCTVSWNYYGEHNKNCLLGHSPTNAAEDRGKLKTTYHHNWFNATSQRNPRVRFAQVHVYNNYFYYNSGYGVGSTCEAQAFVEGNCFEKLKYPATNSEDMSGDPKGGIWFIGDQTDQTNPFTNTFISPDNGMVIDHNRVGFTFRPYENYDYSDSFTEPSKVKALVMAKAGIEGDNLTLDPTAPAGLEAEIVKSDDVWKYRASWSRVYGATKYTLQWSTDNNTWTTVDNLTTTDYVLSDSVVLDKEYFFKVSSTNAIGTSVYSAVNSVKLATPAKPTITKITPKDAGFDIAWDAADNASSYVVTVQLMSNDVPSGDPLIEKTTQTAISITGLKAESNYQITVAALNGDYSVASDPQVKMTPISYDFTEDFKNYDVGNYTATSAKDFNNIWTVSAGTATIASEADASDQRVLKNGTTPLGFYLKETPMWGDQTITMKYKLLAGSTSNVLKLYGRYIDSKNYYCLNAKPTGSSSKIVFSIIKCVNGTSTTLKTGSTVTLSDKLYHTMQFTITNNALTGYFDFDVNNNNVPISVVSSTDSVLKYGGTGAYMDYAANNVVIDSIAVHAGAYTGDVLKSSDSSVKSVAVKGTAIPLKSGVYQLTVPYTFAYSPEDILVTANHLKATVSPVTAKADAAYNYEAVVTAEDGSTTTTVKINLLTEPQNAIQILNSAYTGTFAAGEKISIGATMKNNSVLEPKNVKLCIALYKDGTLKAMNSATGIIPMGATSTLSASVDLPDDLTGYTIKSFLVDDFGNLKPYTTYSVYPNAFN